ncbi:MAG: protein BatD [Gammaproteobacteria bacterium]|nr:protein BatD [Gammaproteobacteria bacterium]MCP5425691.1 protein BatD [Gammaproteobacteria bacterium]MCP5459722.1 protein BatD [Gammaproteobacteria bacterium]
MIGVLLCLLPVAFLQAGTVKAFLDRDKILARETVTLTIEIDASANDTNPDLEPLKRDFSIHGTQVNTELRLLNSQPSATTLWRIELEPKRTGTLHIPPLRVGKEQTAALDLTVQAQPSTDSQTDSGTDLFIEVQTEPAKPYVQSQIRFVVRLFCALSLWEGNLTTPEVPNAVVDKLGDDVSYETTRNGRRYQVFERRYAIFPQQSGELTIPALQFQGWVTSDDRRSFFSSTRRRPVSVSSDPVELTVRPRPESFKASHWLPSEDLNLKADWSSNPPQFRVGEPITRTLTLEAKGLSASQLPDLPMPALSWVRSYADQPLKEDRSDGVWRLGRREQRVALVPMKAGHFTLPETRLDWWDTRQDKARTAVIPAVEIEVLPAPGQASTPTPLLPQSRQIPEPAVGMTPTSSSWGSNGGVWPWATAFVLLLWLVTIGAWWRSAKLRQRGNGETENQREISLSVRTAKRALRMACTQNDAAGAAKALLQWADMIWPLKPPRSLGALAMRLEPEARNFIYSLDQALYAPATDPWNGEFLWKAVKRGFPEYREVEQPGVLAHSRLL